MIVFDFDLEAWIGHCPVCDGPIATPEGGRCMECGFHLPDNVTGEEDHLG